MHIYVMQPSRVEGTLHNGIANGWMEVLCIMVYSESVVNVQSGIAKGCTEAQCIVAWLLCTVV